MIQTYYPLLIFFYLLLLNPLFGQNYDSIHTHLEVNKEHNYGILKVSGFVKRPREEVWKKMTSQDGANCTHTREILEYRSKKIGRNKFEAYYKIDYPWPFEDRWQILQLTHDHTRYIISWTRINGTIPMNDGSYTLLQTGDATLIQYRVKFNPGITHVPQWVLNQIIQWQAPQIIKNIQKCFSE